MNELAELTVKAHGGRKRWGQFELVSAHLDQDGSPSFPVEFVFWEQRTMSLHKPYPLKNLALIFTACFALVGPSIANDSKRN